MVKDKTTDASAGVYQLSGSALSLKKNSLVDLQCVYPKEQGICMNWMVLGYTVEQKQRAHWQVDWSFFGHCSWKATCWVKISYKEAELLRDAVKKWQAGDVGVRRDSEQLWLGSGFFLQRSLLHSRVCVFSQAQGE